MAGLYEKIDQHEKGHHPGRTHHRIVCQCRQRDHAPGRSDYHPDGSQPDFVRTDRLHGAVPVPAGHHPGVRPPSTRAWLLSRKCSSPKYLPTASTRSTKPLSPKGRRPSGLRATTIIFDHVGFAYDKKQVLRDVSFTAKEEKSQLWWGHPAPAKAPVRVWPPACGILRPAALPWAAWTFPRWTRRYFLPTTPWCSRMWFSLTTR